MNNSLASSLGPKLRIAIFVAMVLVPFSVARATSVPIDTLTVSSASLSIHITNDGTYDFTGPVSPVVVIMGTYQDPLVGGTNWKIYSTNLTGNPAPTGTVDTSLNTINVDFSSLRGQATLPVYGLLDIALWPLINPPSPASSYSAGAFSLVWSENFSITQAGFSSPVTGTATVTLGGMTTLVPLPAAVWLLGSGILGMIGVARRKGAE